MRSEINYLFLVELCFFLSSAGKKLRRLKTMKNEMRSEINYLFLVELCCFSVQCWKETSTVKDDEK